MLKSLHTLRVVNVHKILQTFRFTYDQFYSATDNTTLHFDVFHFKIMTRFSTGFVKTCLVV